MTDSDEPRDEWICEINIDLTKKTDAELSMMHQVIQLNKALETACGAQKSIMDVNQPAMKPEEIADKVKSFTKFWESFAIKLGKVQRS